MDKIDSFKGQYYFLSNFFYPIILEFDGLTYPSSEHAYQAQKTLDVEERKLFTADAKKVLSPGQAKRLGRKVDVQPHWDKNKVRIMYEIIDVKFNDPLLKQLLIDTWPNELIEGNEWGDTFWGVCNGEGHNHLGRILMDKRLALINDKFFV